MKKILFTIITTLSLYLLLSTSAFAANSVRVHILWHDGLGHNGPLYTTDTNEVRVLKANGWSEQQLGYWNAPTSGTPVYRCYHPTSRRHLYTLDLNEVETICATQGWIKDNNGKPVFYSGGNVPIYRSFNLKYGYHKLGPLSYIRIDTEQGDPIPRARNEGIKMWAVSAPVVH